MKLLPKWCITDKYPALYDIESATAIEQTAKLYGAMNELIEEYNAFVDKINADVEAFINGSKADFELFTTGLRQEFQDFIDVIELKIQAQDKAIDDAIASMNTQLEEGLAQITATLNSMKSELATYTNNLKNELYTYVEEIYNEIKVELPADIKAELDTMKARLDNLLGSATEGSTTFDLEIIDARLGYDNTQYTNLGEAVRTQVSNLHSVKLSLPKDDNGVIVGEVGQFATSDGAGGITWITVVNGNEVSY